jgi:cytochrome P450
VTSADDGQVSAERQRALVPAFESLNSTADRDLWSYFDRIRALGEVVRDDELDAWLVTSYEACKEMARGDDIVWRPVFVPNDDRPMSGLDSDTLVEFMGGGGRRVIFLVEGEQHQRLHRWWMRVFSPNMLASGRAELIRPIVHAQIDRFADKGRAELVSDLASRVPARVIAGLMGLPNDEAWLEHLLTLVLCRLELIQRQADTVADPELVARGLAANHELSEILLPIVRARSSGAGNDMISRLWRDAPELFEDDFDELDILGNAKTMFDGGSRTTVYAASNALYLLLTRPGLQEELRSGGATAVERFVEESLRLFGPVVFRPRVALKDVEVGGVLVKKGETAIAIGLLANRDPARYERPDDVDLHRTAPRDHLSFYFGARACTGQALARAELEEIVSVVLERLEDLRLDPDAEPPSYREFLMRSWRPLHVLFTAPRSARRSLSSA